MASRILTDEQKEAKKARAKAYYEKNKDKIKSRVSAYKKANPEKIKEWDRIRNEKIKLSPELLEKKRERSRIAAHKDYHSNTEKWLARGAKWRAENPEKAKLSYTNYRKNNPEKVRASNHSSYWRNVESRRQLSLDWYRNNKDRASKSHSSWIGTNLDKCRIYNQNRRKKESDGKLSKDIAKRLFALQSGKCACCKSDLNKTKYHLDHIMPLALGGIHADSNIQLLCASCNHSKHAKHPVDFMQARGFLL